MIARGLRGAVLAGLVALPAQAGEPGAPTVSAQLLIALPADRTIAIEPRDDSDENLQLRDLMIARLVERHGATAADAPLLLRFSSEVVSDRGAAAPAGRGGGGGRGGGRNFGAALIGGARNTSSGGPATHPSGGVRYRLSATLERRDGTQVLWKADVSAPMSDENERRLPAALAAAVVDNIGRTIDTRPPPAAQPDTATR